jgi:hypothetical protein
MPLLKTIPPEKAEGNIKETYSFFMDNDMPVPKPLEMMSVSPGVLKIQGQVIAYYMNHPTLGFALLSLIRFLVANEINYQFCTGFNRNFLKMQGMEDDDIDRVIKSPETAPLEEKDTALLLFVLKAIKTPDTVTQADMDALYRLEWTDRDIFDAVNHGTGMIAASYLMKAFQMDAC